MKRLSLVALVVLASCKTSIDFEQGRPYSCSPDAGDDELACGPGWRCGLEGRCHAVGDAKPWQCRADDDCESGWVCGLEQTCHDPAVLADYLCERDEQCPSPWRCGYSGRCLDAAAELSEPTPASAEQVTVLGPRFFTGQAGALVSSDAEGRFAISVGTQVRLLERSGPGRFTVTDFDAGTEPTDLLVDSSGPYVITDGGVRGLGGMQATYVADDRPWLVGGTRQGLHLLEGGMLRGWGSVSGAFAKMPSDPRAVAVANCVYAVNANGLWLQLPGGLGEPSALSISSWNNDTCSPVTEVSMESPLLRTGGRVRTVLAISASSQGGIVVLTRPRNFVSAIDVTQLSLPARPIDPAGTGECVLPPPERSSCGEARITELLPRCAVPCDVGDVLTDLRPTDTALEVECTGRLGQTTWSIPYGECEAVPLTGTSSRFRETRSPGDGSLTASHLVQRGPHGQVWVGDSITKAEPLVLDEPAVALLRPKQPDGMPSAEPVVMTTKYAARPDPQLGLLASPSPEALAYVSGTNGLAVLKGGNVSELAQDGEGVMQVSERRAALDVLPEELRQPVTAALVQRGSVPLLLVAVNERIYAADEPSWDKKVPLRLVPQPGFSVLSLTVLPGPGVSGYLNTRVGVFRFTSSSEQDWEAWPIPLPPGQLLETWADQGRARVGYADGRVLTLPSGVPLTQVNERREVVDYLGVCGQIFGLTRTGVARLDEAGHWADVPLPGAEVVLGDTLAGGRMLEKDGTIYVFNGSGGGLTFRLSSGCAQ